MLLFLLHDYVHEALRHFVGHLCNVDGFTTCHLILQLNHHHFIYAFAQGFLHFHKPSPSTNSSVSLPISVSTVDKYKTTHNPSKSLTSGWIMFLFRPHAGWRLWERPSFRILMQPVRRNRNGIV